MADNSNPTRALIGVGGLGTGVLLLYCAYRNVKPTDVLRQIVTTGNLDISKLPHMFGPSAPTNPPDAPGNPNNNPGPNLPGGGEGPGQRLPGGGHAGP